MSRRPTGAPAGLGGASSDLPTSDRSRPFSSAGPGHPGRRGQNRRSQLRGPRRPRTRRCSCWHHSSRPFPAAQGGVQQRDDNTDDDPGRLLHGGTPHNCRQPRLGLSGQLLWSGRAKASSVGSTFTLPAHSPARPPHPGPGARHRAPGRQPPAPPHLPSQRPDRHTVPHPGAAHDATAFPARPGGKGTPMPTAGSAPMHARLNPARQAKPPQTPPVRGRPWKASGYTNRATSPDFVRHASVTTATRRSTAAHADTWRDIAKRPA